MNKDGYGSATFAVYAT